MSKHASSTLTVPEVRAIPRHVAIIMDGNGRWASKRFMPRVAGHSEGLSAVRKIVQECRRIGVEYLTVFAFSSENWRRPPEEVGFLMKLFLRSLKGEVSRLAENDISLRLIGDLSRFGAIFRGKNGKLQRLNFYDRCQLRRTLGYFASYAPMFVRQSSAAT